MKKVKWIIILLNLVLLLGLFNHSVFKKEAILSSGKLVLFELAPVDPRSLMQGDYMRLRYKISDNIDFDSIPKRGFCVIKLLPNGTALRVRFQKNRSPLYNYEHLIEYRQASRFISIGAESFFFQEGQEDKYKNAKYGGIKIDNQGNSILVGLFNEKRQKIE